MKVNAIQCQNCKDIIFSRARHDFRSCNCGKVSIDGGFDYIRIAFSKECFGPEVFDYEVEATKKELYDDWNNKKNLYGLFKPWRNK